MGPQLFMSTEYVCIFGSPTNKRQQQQQWHEHRAIGRLAGILRCSSGASLPRPLTLCVWVPSINLKLLDIVRLLCGWVSGFDAERHLLRRILRGRRETSSGARGHAYGTGRRQTGHRRTHAGQHGEEEGRGAAGGEGYNSSSKLSRIQPLCHSLAGRPDERGEAQCSSAEGSTQRCTPANALQIAFDLTPLNSAD